MLPFKFLLLWHKCISASKKDEFPFSFDFHSISTMFFIFNFASVYFFHFPLLLLRVFIFHSFVLCTENIVISCFIAAYASTHFQRFIPCLCCKEITNFEIFFRFSATIDNLNWQKKIKIRKYQ